MADLGVATQQQVYLGAWTNWSHGRVLGATITMSQQNGAFLVAFLALFVSFVGTSFFRITCFVFHQMYSSDSAQDGLYHQRQAILRNSANGTDAAWRMTELMWYWRHHRRFQRLLPLVISTTLTALAFSAAGIFSSRISALTGSEVLIERTERCGYPVIFNASVPTEALYGIKYASDSERFTSFLDYAQNCYSSSENSNQGLCDSFLQPRLPISVTRNASCPFREDICRTSNGNVLFDTGYLDSHYDLGYNAPRSERLQFRRQLHCAPLSLENHTDHHNYSDDSTGFANTYQRFFYGPRSYKNGTIMDNATSSQPESSPKEMEFFKFSSSNADYGLKSFQARVENGTLSANSDFIPVDALSRDDADVSLLFLASNNVVFTDKVDDYWYAAHQFFYNSSTTAGTEFSATYVADEAASAVGCTTKYQYCLPGLPEGHQCTRWFGLVECEQNFLALTPDQYDMVLWILGSSFLVYELEDIVDAVGVSLLASRYGLNEGRQGPLPDNQWQIDFERLNNISLAAMQGMAVTTATGPSNAAELEQFWELASTDVEKYFCRNQKIRSDAYTNVSIFGLSFTLIVGTIVIILHYALESLVTCVQKRRNLPAYAMLEWRTNGTLQLQRLAHEELGLGSWSRCDGDVPTTEEGDQLAVLDLGDVKHPRLVRPGGSGDPYGDEAGEALGKEIGQHDSVGSSDAGQSPTSVDIKGVEGVGGEKRGGAG